MMFLWMIIIALLVYLVLSKSHENSNREIKWMIISLTGIAIAGIAIMSLMGWTWIGMGFPGYCSRFW